MTAPSRINQYVFSDKIGSGSFGSVYKATNSNDGKVVAIKVIPKNSLEEDGDHDRFQREINAMAFIRHENIVSLNDFAWDSENFYLVLDYCPGGELFDYIVDHEKVAEPIAALIMRQIVAALGHCHSFGVAHRDLKPENILIEKFPNIKVSDFGLCGYLSQGKLMKTFCGSPCYCSPECLCRIQYDGRISDVWSLGVILFAMVTGEHPWNISNTSIMLRQILKGQFSIPSFVSADCKDLISRMLTVEVSKRISLDEIANHPWLKLAKVLPQGRSLPDRLVLPTSQPMSLEELSEASSRSSQRSEEGIYSPLLFRSSSLVNLTNQEKESKIVRVSKPSLSIGANRQKSSHHLVQKKTIIAPIITMSTIVE